MYKEVIDFWFRELTPKDWFAGGEELDKLIKSRFGDLQAQAAQCELSDWRESAQGRLAEVIVLDQFSRNIHRGTPAAFASDPLALALAQETIRLGLDKELTQTERTFLYMPFMHSESLKVHEHAVELFKGNGVENNLDYEYKHKVIVERFGRYPHRNEILGRVSTEEEIQFLKQPGSSF
ncbi:conserved hypothetical protein [Vibrio nigripulchritudo MADA3029]|uniref:DUF924 family protein n=1 Tax=Vibrio nigripulchritudo TaxID=28173 RepID=UPI0003B1E744|nr:DUF924 family protein [Vibrio nigripulchritudo]CCN45125.1 conserved hypothetical protein [Vibrio nigripulchritudo MADA3020]CCN54463.1 conserved hypothetical protein [Vibrio nigripulchritudo MADA3021]CCN57513.1 conserved hypothetical protein [Vibrio nigripulchritudo MADA3029]